LRDRPPRPVPRLREPEDRHAVQGRLPIPEGRGPEEYPPRTVRLQVGEARPVLVPGPGTQRATAVHPGGADATQGLLVAPDPALLRLRVAGQILCRRAVF